MSEAGAALLVAQALPLEGEQTDPGETGRGRRGDAFVEGAEARAAEV